MFFFAFKFKFTYNKNALYNMNRVIKNNLSTKKTKPYSEKLIYFYGSDIQLKSKLNGLMNNSHFIKFVR